RGRHRVPSARPPIDSGLAHARNRLFSGASSNGFGDTRTDIGIDVAPVVEGTFEDLGAQTSEKAAAHRFDEPLALRIIHDLTNEGTGLAEVVIVLTKFVGGPDHLTVDGPGFFEHRATVGIVSTA